MGHLTSANYLAKVPALLKSLLALAILLPAVLSVSACRCGFDCDRDNDRDNSPATLTLGLSDAAVEELAQVVIEIDSITLRRSGAADVVIDVFTIDALNLEDADSFQVDLLDYRGRNQLVVVEAMELDVGTYSEVLITLLEDDVNHSFVEEADGTLRILSGPAGGLSLPGITLTAGSADLTVEFGLAQALRYTSSDQTYLLATDGVRIEDNEETAGLSGRVDSGLFDTVAPCDAKQDPQAGNRVYLYEGANLTDSILADVYTIDSNDPAIDNAVAPFAVAALVQDATSGGWEYVFGFLPAGDYTLAFSCNAADDDPVDYDGLVIPLATDQRYEISLSEGELAVCDLADNASCP